MKKGRKHDFILIAVVAVIISIVFIYTEISKNQINKYTKYNAKENTVIGFLIVLLLSYLIYIRVQTKKEKEKIIQSNERVVKNYEQILTATAVDNYRGIRRVDLETGNSEYIYFEDGSVKQEETGEWMVWLERQKRHVHSKDFSKVSTLLDLYRLREMKEGEKKQVNYRSVVKNESGFHNMYTSTVSILKVDGRRTALVTIIDTTDAVINEIEQKRWLSSAASIYVSMHAIDLENDKMETLSSAEHITKLVGNRNSNIQGLLKEVMIKLTDEQFMDEMMKFIDFSTLDERMKNAKTITLEFVGNKSGWCRARFIVVDYNKDGYLSRVLWVVENIDDEKRKANRLLYLSETDLMTGISNRGSGEKKIKELIEANNEGMFCLIDADNFKEINDNFGHDIGDKVIVSIARCLKLTFEDCGVVLRLGGDEFAAFAKGINNKEKAFEKINLFFDAVEHINIPELGKRKITVSLGAAFKNIDDGIGFEQLYRNADSCTYRSKIVEGNACEFFE